MAVRNHLELVPISNELRPTGDDDIIVWQKYALYYYGLDPSVKVVPHTTNSETRSYVVADIMVDYRRIAGLGATSTGPIDDNYLNTLGAQQDLDLAFVEYQRRLTYSASHPWSLNGPRTDYNLRTAYPVYYNQYTNTIQSMSVFDFMDTFIYPAIDKFFNATLSNGDYVWRAGEYFISTDFSDQTKRFDSQGNFLNSDSRVNGIFQPIFADTIADPDAYVEDDLLYEDADRDQPEPTNNGIGSGVQYHLRVVDPILPPEIPYLPLYLDTDGNLQQYTLNEFVTMLGEHFKWQAYYGRFYGLDSAGVPAYGAGNTGEYCIQYKVEQLYSGTINFLGNNPTDLNYTKKAHRGTVMYNESRNFDDYTFLSKEFSADDYRAQRVPSSAAAEIKQEYRMFVVNDKSP